MQQMNLVSIVSAARPLAMNSAGIAIAIAAVSVAAPPLAALSTGTFACLFHIMRSFGSR